MSSAFVEPVEDYSRLAGLDAAFSPDIEEVFDDERFEAGRALSILGVQVTDLKKARAIALLEQVIRQASARTRAIYIVNAHTLNLACEDEHYRWALNNAFRVFGDGTGVRWAARARGVRLHDNLVGTDLIPELFAATAGAGHRYFLLGATDETICRAAATAQARFPGWELAGCHHGYVQTSATAAAAIAQINDSQADLLLVGMGNPLQELWIHRHLKDLRVPLAIGVGGLFDHWAGNLQRAPRWVRALGYEWLQILLQQPHKWRRYVLGNPKFLYRMIRDLRRERFAEPATA
ncbi:MAG TPA: WecB/TagA/CpsF family glycosyltransferase [Pirellulales bacterium]|jgi:N-acetylglucosaminyldiphosphoundecaprenol N-acetyl-beta-D-mannosaminyltransferase|nr:WecB/TagA/CpsF family glycosyltransferase [Pirellulales bacterium]